MARVKIGIVGCGAVAQVQHLPNLAELRDEFEIAAVCDVSASLVRTIAEEFGVPQHFTDYRDLLAADLDAVLLCQSDPKTAVAVAAFEAGKHVFIEKPMCFTLSDADAIASAARSAGRVGQVGYMKVYDPAFELVEREVAGMDNIRFVQVNHLHTDNSHHLDQFRLHRFDDVPEQMGAELAEQRRAAVSEALGDVPSGAKRAFFHLSGSMIHDLYGLRTLFGQPVKVASTEVWNDGEGITTVLEFASGARCAATWVELRNIRHFTETLEVYGDDRGIVLSYPTGFARGQLSTGRGTQRDSLSRSGMLWLVDQPGSCIQSHRDPIARPSDACRTQRPIRSGCSMMWQRLSDR